MFVYMYVFFAELLLELNCFLLLFQSEQLFFNHCAYACDCTCIFCDIYKFPNDQIYILSFTFQAEINKAVNLMYIKQKAEDL